MPELPPQKCRVYWGPHGCSLSRGHDGHHRCGCADDPDPEGNVGAWPYYGADTYFYGEDVETFNESKLADALTAMVEEEVEKYLARHLKKVTLDRLEPLMDAVEEVLKWSDANPALEPTFRALRRAFVELRGQQ